MIPIFIVNGNVFVWKCDDVCCLRENHRIVGTLVGCLPRATKQNIHLGLPLQLLKEEARLLIDKGICKLLDGNIAPRLPTNEEVEKFEAHRQECYQAQVAWSKEDKRKELIANRDIILSGKRAKIIKSGGEVDEEKLQKEVDAIIEKRKVQPLPYDNSVVQVQTGTANYKSVEEKLAEWSYPNTDEERLRSLVFKDLWEKGYYLTSAGKFGGTFLIYPGDPGRFHSFYIAVVVLPEKQLDSQEIAALSRLGTSVKKNVLICSQNKLGEITYVTLQWAGI